MDVLYLDVCCLKRPFDDPSQARVRREAAAVAEILERAEAGRVALVRSVAHRIENDANPREDRRLATALWLDRFAVEASLTPGAERRARELHAAGFAPLDALHLALAEAAGAAALVTCADRLAALARRHGGSLRTRVLTPPEATESLS